MKIADTQLLIGHTNNTWLARQFKQQESNRFEVMIMNYESK